MWLFHLCLPAEGRRTGLTERKRERKREREKEREKIAVISQARNLEKCNRNVKEKIHPIF